LTVDSSKLKAKDEERDNAETQRQRRQVCSGWQPDIKKKHSMSFCQGKSYVSEKKRVGGEVELRGESLQNVFALQVGIVGEDLFNRMARADLTDDHAHSDAHSAYARLSAHDVEVLCDAIQLRPGDWRGIAVLAFRCCGAVFCDYV